MRDAQKREVCTEYPLGTALASSPGSGMTEAVIETVGLGTGQIMCLVASGVLGLLLVVLVTLGNSVIIS